ncbi:MAG: hypothetical protein IJB98_01470 [Clostridia bacterium]|nr:hypothetical protein [Clostridia bacterium]
MIKHITVITKMTSSGNVIPLSIIWEDGREFVIDKILDIRPKASTKGGGKGIRYTVRIKGQEKYLFLNEYLWFIEQ